MLKSAGSFSKTALFEDELLKSAGSSSKTALFEDELLKKLTKGSLTAPPPYSRPAPSLKKGNLDVLRKEGPCCVSNREVFPVQ
ncbi:MAG: hypothetical protein WC896_08965, partial [Bacteroidales bacterium]